MKNIDIQDLDILKTMKSQIQALENNNNILNSEIQTLENSNKILNSEIQSLKSKIVTLENDSSL